MPSNGRMTDTLGRNSEGSSSGLIQITVRNLLEGPEEESKAPRPVFRVSLPEFQPRNFRIRVERFTRTSSLMCSAPHFV